MSRWRDQFVILKYNYIVEFDSIKKCNNCGHSLTHQFYEMSMNMYMLEEIKLLVDRKTLLKDHQRKDTEEDLNQFSEKDKKQR